MNKKTQALARQSCAFQTRGFCAFPRVKTRAYLSCSFHALPYNIKKYLRNFVFLLRNVKCRFARYVLKKTVSTVLSPLVENLKSPLLPKKPFRRRRFCAGTRFSRSAFEIIAFQSFPRSREISVPMFCRAFSAGGFYSFTQCLRPGLILSRRWRLEFAEKITKMERQDAAPPKKPFRRRRFCAGTRFSRSALEIVPFPSFLRFCAAFCPSWRS